ncbi:MAG: hypothetical protein PVJ66_03640 [Gammaproteobacteria bacterium]|jgi:hypothetical protein
MTKPRAYIVHQTRCRVRLRVRDRRKDPAYFEQVRDKLDPLSGIMETRINSTTGCILLLHPQIPWSELAARLRQLDLFTIMESPEPVRPAIEPLAAGISTLDRLIADESAGVLDLKTLAYIGLMVFTVRQIMLGNVLGPAVPMLWNAMSLADRFHALKKGTDS